MSNTQHKGDDPTADTDFDPDVNEQEHRGQHRDFVLNRLQSLALALCSFPERVDLG